MKPFDQQTKAPAAGRPPARERALPQSAQTCAAMLLETVPRIMRALRLAIGAHEQPALTVPQFRALHYVQFHPGASLSAAAEFLGLTLPSTSKLVDHMVRRSLLARNNDATDRRRMTLRLTPKGDALLKAAHRALQQHLAGTLERFGSAELRALESALGLLQESFPSPDHAPENGAGGNGVSDIRFAARVAASS